mmetsp:Transcript_97527/g.172664  ORF Transcript_97527/g.172664 Transcript_97527/m.172664 type:complete len:229 (-) Transcript_97527:368-1054(-)
MSCGMMAQLMNVAYACATWFGTVQTRPCYQSPCFETLPPIVTPGAASCHASLGVAILNLSMTFWSMPRQYDSLLFFFSIPLPFCSIRGFVTLPCEFAQYVAPALQHAWHFPWYCTPSSYVHVFFFATNFSLPRGAIHTESIVLPPPLIADHLQPWCFVASSPSPCTHVKHLFSVSTQCCGKKFGSASSSDGFAPAMPFQLLAFQSHLGGVFFPNPAPVSLKLFGESCM